LRKKRGRIKNKIENILSNKKIQLGRCNEMIHCSGQQLNDDVTRVAARIRLGRDRDRALGVRRAGMREKKQKNE
jgi:hypothetical protein